MPIRRILLTWIGYADFRALAGTLPSEQQRTILNGLNPPTPLSGQAGPVKTLLDLVAFDEVHLLSSHPNERNEPYAEWVRQHHPVIHRVTVQDPTDYVEVFGLVDGLMSHVITRPRLEQIEVCILLSPGTPTMTAVWVLLGKSKYHPVTFYQTHEGRAWETSIPFDLIVDFVPQVLRDADARFQLLAAQSPQEVEGFQEIVGDSPGIRLAVGRSRRAARRDVSVLLLGESGTGKELFAQAIHHTSTRRKGPFVAINCAALSRELLESELFGHKKGAFTGADQDREGAFAAANGGTLFLDEVGECDLAMQAKLLRVLQPPDGEPTRRLFQRVGDAKTISSDVRVIAATNRNLLESVASNQFREDLYYRLAVITIKLPPLRDRRNDLTAISQRILERINGDFARGEPGYLPKRLTSGAQVLINTYSWPGNVRQLYNALLQAAVLTDGDKIERQDIEEAIADVPQGSVDLLNLPLGDGFSLDQHLEEIKKHYLRRGLAEAKGVQRRAAQLLGYRNYQTLAAQLERLGINGNKLTS